MALMVPLKAQQKSAGSRSLVNQNSFWGGVLVAAQKSLLVVMSCGCALKRSVVLCKQGNSDLLSQKHPVDRS